MSEKEIFAPEVLSPAGDMEKFYSAVNFGADAVYLGGTEFGMRASAARFDTEALRHAVSYAHDRNVKVYLTCNTLPRNSELKYFPDYITQCRDTGIDAAIVTDLGLMSMIKKYVPELEIHVSTQAGIVNYESANEFYRLGAKRVVLARELSLEEIVQIRQNTPSDLELEVFVHGAMCMSFSGRCLLSNYMINRDANRGECAQPCRWGYYLVEEKRPNEYYRIFEDEKGSYILNAKDLCMIEYIDKLIETGVTSLKIEGRAKSSYYVAVITNAYRIAVDTYMKNPDAYTFPAWLKNEVCKVSHRQYSTGFFFGRPENGQYYENGGYIREYDVAAFVDDCDGEFITCIQKTKFSSGDKVEILSPGKAPFEFVVTGIFDADSGERLESASHPHMKIKIPFSGSLVKGSIIRRQK